MVEKVQPGNYTIQFQMKRQPNSTYVALDNIKLTLNEVAKTDNEIDPPPPTTTTATTIPSSTSTISINSTMSTTTTTTK